MWKLPLRPVALAAAVIVVLIAWALRLYHLATQSLWVDEGFSYEVSRQGLRAIAAILPAEDRHPPLHYILVWLTIRLSGPSEFSLRFLSAGVGLLAVPFTYRVGRFFGGRRAGLVAAALLALSPFHVWYSQEARMYALLATLGIASFFFWVLANARGGRINWAIYALATTGALYTHYYGVFLLPAHVVTGWILARRWRTQILAPVLPLLLFAPWLVAIWRQYQRAPGGYQPELALPDVVWNILVTYVQGEHDVTVTAVVVGAGAVALLGVLPVVSREHDPPAPLAQRYAGLLLVILVLAAPVGAYVCSTIMSLDIRATGRMYYVVGLPAFLLLVARGLVWLDVVRHVPFGSGDVAMRTVGTGKGDSGTPPIPRPDGVARRRPQMAVKASAGLEFPVLALLGLTLAAVIHVPALQRQYTERPKEDFRSAAQFIQLHEWPGDATILDAEYIFRPFAYYFHGAAPWYRAVVEAERVDAALAEQTAGRERVWLVLSHDGVADPEQRVQRWLDERATLLDEQWFPGIHLRLYGMEPRPRLEPPAVGDESRMRLGGIVEIVSIEAPTDVAGGDTVRLKLVWHAIGRLEENVHVAMQITDASGQVWGHLDRIPISPFYQPTQWQPGEYLTDRYEIRLPIGLPPGEYAIRLRLYAPSNGRALAIADPPGGEDVALGTIRVGRSVSPTPLAGVSISPALRLIEATLNRTSAHPGEDVLAELLWQATAVPDPGNLVVLRLLDSGGIVVTEQLAPPAKGTHPFERWQVSEVVRERQIFRLPSRVPAGRYRIQIGLAAEGAEPPVLHDIGEVKVEDVTRSYELPPISHRQQATLGDAIEFVGYDLEPSTLHPGAALRLTLYWRALGEPLHDYTVFTHLVGPDERIFGQRDNAPVAGARPTTSWMTGEVIRDTYEIALDENAPSGTYYLAVGMYLPTTGERLPFADGDTRLILSERMKVDSKQ